MRKRIGKLKNSIEGFDYRKQAMSKLSKEEWKQELRQALSDGGMRRVENNETFVKDQLGRIQFEIYGTVSA